MKWKRSLDEKEKTFTVTFGCAHQDFQQFPLSVGTHGVADSVESRVLFTFSQAVSGMVP